MDNFFVEWLRSVDKAIPGDFAKIYGAAAALILRFAAAKMEALILAAPSDLFFVDISINRAIGVGI